MEPYLFEWCLYEYLAMKSYLKGTPSQLWITNSKAFLDYQGEEDIANKKYIAILKEEFSALPLQFRLVRDSLQEMELQL